MIPSQPFKRNPKAIGGGISDNDLFIVSLHYKSDKNPVYWGPFPTTHDAEEWVKDQKDENDPFSYKISPMGLAKIFKPSKAEELTSLLEIWLTGNETGGYTPEILAQYEGKEVNVHLAAHCNSPTISGILKLAPGYPYVMIGNLPIAMEHILLILHEGHQ
jgi:hypothetical protein